MSWASQMGMYWRFVWGLRKYLKEPITLEQAQQIIKQGLVDREINLLNMVKRAIYENEASPYLKLLRLAGCEYGDFERMVLSNGIEPTLEKLREEGVYLSYAEFKEGKTVVRGGKTFQFKEGDFDNTFLVPHLESRSGASRSTGTRIKVDLKRYHHQAAYNRVAFAAHGIWGSPVSVWFPILPSMAGLWTMLTSAKLGNLPIRWFSQVEAGAIKPALVNRLATYYTVYSSRLFGAAFPKPEYVNLDRAHEVAGFMAEVLKKGQGCVLWTYPNCAIRVCRAASEGKLNISGATFILMGEPLTEVKAREIDTTGATAITIYGASEVGVVGFACANPIAADDVHLLKDSHALIQHRREVPFAKASVDAFLFTSLLPKAAKILLNVECGDYGVVETRRHCGCKLGELGFTEHIYNIRGFDKLTGEGMTFIGTDLLRVIEEVLPAKFGGTSTDYQMVEEEDDKGQTRLTIIASPEVGVIDEGELIQTVLTELRKGVDGKRMMANMWSQAKTLRVKRITPYTTSRGKLLPLHIQKGQIINDQ